MTAQYTYRGAALACAIAAAIVACSSSDLLVGDDSTDAATTTETSVLPDAPGPSEKDAAPDVVNDAPPGPCSSMLGATCLPKGTACKQADATGLTCPGTGFCCLTICPELAQPAPGFCDGGPYAPTYDTKACINGFACAPVLCTAAGGMCVGLSPTSCMNGHAGDATKYSCGGGLGVMCCLP